MEAYEGEGADAGVGSRDERHVGGGGGIRAETEARGRETRIDDEGGKRLGVGRATAEAWTAAGGTHVSFTRETVFLLVVQEMGSEWVGRAGPMEA